MQKTEDVASPCFHTKADVIQWIGANGRKWRARLLSLPYQVLEKMTTIFGVSQSRHRGQRMLKDQLGKLVCQKAVKEMYQVLDQMITILGRQRMPKKCSMPRCRNDAASPRARFCTGCFKKNASSAIVKRKVHGGGQVLTTSRQQQSLGVHITVRRY